MDMEERERRALKEEPDLVALSPRTQDLLRGKLLGTSGQARQHQQVRASRLLGCLLCLWYSRWCTRRLPKPPAGLMSGTLP